jgi:hypothetical protein
MRASSHGATTDRRVCRAGSLFVLLTASLLLRATPVFAATQPAAAPDTSAPKAVALVAIPFPPMPSDAPKPTTDPRDLEGFYVRLSAPQPVTLMEDGKPLPYLPGTFALLQHRIAMMKAGKPLASPQSFCLPSGLFWNFGLNFPFRIIQQPKQILFLFQEGHALWRIHMGGDAAINPPLSYEGYSTGHWEGDTLVVKTIRLRAETWLDLLGTPHSDQAVYVTRIRKIGSGSQLELRTTVTDPVDFSAPWTTRAVVDWRPDQSQLTEYNCEESSGSDAEAQRYGTVTDEYDPRHFYGRTP